MTQTISIIGCGWLGIPLAESLLAAGHRVKGSTTTKGKLKALKELGVDPYHLIIHKEGIDGSAEDAMAADMLVLDFPPDREEPHKYAAQMQQVLAALDKMEAKPWVLMVSSTSVYPDANRIILPWEPFEPDSERGRMVREAEQVLEDGLGERLSILRLGGLFGPGRHPGKWLAGQVEIEGGKNPINLIHLDDAVGIIQTLLEQRQFGKHFHAATPLKPNKKKFYSKMAEQLGRPLPDFTEGPRLGFKIIQPDQLIEDLNYAFRHPDPMKIPASRLED